MDKRFSHQQLMESGTFNTEDLKFIRNFRGEANRLGSAYQLIYIRLLNTVPKQAPFNVIDEILTYAALQLCVNGALIDVYRNNRKKIRVHQKKILEYTSLKSFDSDICPQLEEYISEQAHQYEQLSLLMIKADRFLRRNNVLLPSESQLGKIVSTRRNLARQSMFDSITSKLSAETRTSLDGLLKAGSGFSTLESLKRAPKNPSEDSVHSLILKLRIIEDTGILSVSIDDINNNYQRALAGEVKRCSVARLRELDQAYRYSSLVSFLLHCYSETVDFVIKTFISLLNSSYTKSDNRITQKFKEHKDSIRDSLEVIQRIREILANPDVDGESLRKEIMNTIGDTEDDIPELDQLRNGRYSNVFLLLAEKYGYFRKFMPKILSSAEFTAESGKSEKLLKAVDLLNELNRDKKKKFPGNAPTSFLSRTLKPVIHTQDGKIDRRIWECGVYYKLRDELKNGNVNVGHSKRYRSMSSFNISNQKWNAVKGDFFRRAGLPENPKKAAAFLKERLNSAYDRYFELAPKNTFARVADGKWQLSAETATLLSPDEEAKLNDFSEWIEKRMRVIRLPDLLLEVNNDLNFTDPFIIPAGSENKYADDICGIIAAIMAHGCNIGVFTMSKLVQNISYSKIRSISDWQLTEDAIRTALSWIVNAISKLAISQNWGSGETSSSDPHLKIFRQKVISRQYSPRLGDFALEFLTFIADNFAPYHSKPIECTEGEAPNVLDGFLYNESDLLLTEHFTDTRAAATIIFAAFEWFGKKFNPRIRGIQRHHIFRIDRNYDYRELEPLLDFQGANINMDLVTDFWTRMAKLYSSIEQGQATASVVLRRLLSRDESNDFYKANLHLGRIFKTEHILQHMTDPQARLRKRRGLLKGEQIHQLARDVNYANRGKITARDDKSQNLVCSCLTLIMACIVYWQAKELTRVMKEHNPEEAGFNLELLAHISPVGWGNIILYGEYFINRNLVRV